MSKRAKTYHEIEDNHCILKIRQEREERDEYNKSIGKSQRGFELHSPRLRANASLKTVVKHARDAADFALRRYRIERDWWYVLRDTSQVREYQNKGHEVEMLRDRWHTLEEIAQHLERLT